MRSGAMASGRILRVRTDASGRSDIKTEGASSDDLFVGNGYVLELILPQNIRVSFGVNTPTKQLWFLSYAPKKRFQGSNLAEHFDVEWSFLLYGFLIRRFTMNTLFKVSSSLRIPYPEV